MWMRFWRWWRFHKESNETSIKRDTIRIRAFSRPSTPKLTPSNSLSGFALKYWRRYSGNRARSGTLFDGIMTGMILSSRPISTKALASSLTQADWAECSEHIKIRNLLSLRCFRNSSPSMPGVKSDWSRNIGRKYRLPASTSLWISVGSLKLSRCFWSHLATAISLWL